LAGYRHKSQVVVPDGCGTYRGYNRHIEEKTPVCWRCALARTHYNQQWYQDNREQVLARVTARRREKGMKPKPGYTRAELATIRRMKAEGHTAREIAAKLKRPVRGLEDKIGRMKKAGEL
jgi:hypothetical protein